MGVSARHRAPARRHPANELFGWMLVLAPTFGILLAASMQATAAQDHLWAGFFWIFTLATVLTYFYVTLQWIKYLN